MQDEFQTESAPEEMNSIEGSSPNAGEAASGPESMSAASATESTEELFPSTTESSTTSGAGRAPAATASSYRDIIAERLARKAGPGTPAPRPMAHASDVENAAPKPVPAPAEAPASEAAPLPREIEEVTKMQEIPASEATEAPAAVSTGESARELSSRERARMRQQERAALRRGEQRRSQPAEVESEETPSMLEASPKAEISLRPEPTMEQKDIIAERLARRGADRGPEQRERRPADEARPERGMPEEGRPQRERRMPEEGRSEQRERRMPEEGRMEPRERRMPEEGRQQRDRRGPEEGRPERRPREERRLEAGGRLEEPRREQAPREERREGGPELRTAEERQARPRPERVQGERPQGRPQERTQGERPTELRRRDQPSAQRPTEARTVGAEEKGTEGARSLASKLGISIVVPLYNEQESLRELTALVKQQCLRLAGPKYEIIYVNDGSTDRSGDILEDILATSSRVTVLSFRRNLGKSAALAAGFAEAQYGIVITMDADLQDDPHEFVNLIGKLAEGYDLVSGWKKKRHDPISKTIPSKFFNTVTGLFSGIRLHDFNCGLKAYRKDVTDSLQVYGELHRYLPALAHWQGFRVAEIPVVHHPRKFGKSKFGSSRFFKGFLDLLSIVFTNRYGKRPLHLFGTIGTLLAIAGFVIDIWVSVEWILGKTALSNRPILQLGVLLILVGAQLISIGLLGEMIVKNAASRANLTYQKEKGRPSAEARERRASRAARVARISSGRPSGERRQRRPQ